MHESDLPTISTQISSKKNKKKAEAPTIDKSSNTKILIQRKQILMNSENAYISEIKLTENLSLRFVLFRNANELGEYQGMINTHVNEIAVLMDQSERMIWGKEAFTTFRRTLSDQQSKWASGMFLLRNNTLMMLSVMDLDVHQTTGFCDWVLNTTPWSKTNEEMWIQYKSARAQFPFKSPCTIMMTFTK